MAALGAFLLAATAVVVGFMNAGPQLRLAAALLSTGPAIVHGMVTYGVWRRAGWSTWAGGVLSALTLALLSAVLFFGFSRAEPGGRTFEIPPLTAALAWGRMAANGLFLAGLALLRLRAL